MCLCVPDFRRFPFHDRNGTGVERVEWLPIQIIVEPTTASVVCQKTSRLLLLYSTGGVIFRASWFSRLVLTGSRRFVMAGCAKCAQARNAAAEAARRVAARDASGAARNAQIVARNIGQKVSGTLGRLSPLGRGR